MATAAYDSGTKLSSAVASAAYRSGEVLHDAQANKTFDYRRKENIIHKEIMTPRDVPAWAMDRQSLWNGVEAAEKRKDAQLARSIIAALPRELSHEQNIQLVREFVADQFVARGMIADIALHDKDASDGGRNPHVHIMLTLRDVSADGFGKKNRVWNDQRLVSLWRDAWEKKTNDALEAAGFEERVSLKSYEEQGIDKIPQEHLGYEAAALERKGKETRIGDYNREVRQENAVREAAPKEPLPEAVFGGYSREEIEGYYQKQWEAETALYEPDTAALEAIREKETHRDKPQAGRWERYIAERRETRTWYGASETRTLYAWRRVTDRLGAAEMEERHAQALQQSLSRSFHITMRETAERVGRMAQRVKEKVTELGHNIFDRYASGAERTQGKAWEQGRDRGYER